MLNKLLEELLQDKNIFSYENGRYSLLYDKDQEELKRKIYIDEQGDIVIEEGN